jgi:hypothetical protein
MRTNLVFLFKQQMGTTRWKCADEGMASVRIPEQPVGKRRGKYSLK